MNNPIFIGDQSIQVPSAHAVGVIPTGILTGIAPRRAPPCESPRHEEPRMARPGRARQTSRDHHARGSGEEIPTAGLEAFG